MLYRPEPWALAVLAAVLTAAAWSDLRAGRIRNAVTYPAIAIGLIGQTLLGGPDGLARAAGGFAAGFGPLLVFWTLGGIGGGDAKLAGAVGALTNWHFTLATMAMAFLIAAGMALAVMIRRRIVLRTVRRIGRALVLAVVPGVKGGWGDDADSPTIPFGVALCLGAAVAMVDSYLGGPLSRGLLGG